jgi:hypothetical protein
MFWHPSLEVHLESLLCEQHRNSRLLAGYCPKSGKAGILLVLLLLTPVNLQHLLSTPATGLKDSHQCLLVLMLMLLLGYQLPQILLPVISTTLATQQQLQADPLSAALCPTRAMCTFWPSHLCCKQPGASTQLPHQVQPGAAAATSILAATAQQPYAWCCR